MGEISPQTTSKHLDVDGIEAHYGALDGYNVGFEFSAHDKGPAPLFTGARQRLPGSPWPWSWMPPWSAAHSSSPSCALPARRLVGSADAPSPGRPLIHPPKRHRAGPGGPARDGRQPRSRLMGALAFLLIVVALGLAAMRWGVDTRTSHDPRDRYWWPNG